MVFTASSTSAGEYSRAIYFLREECDRINVALQGQRPCGATRGGSVEEAPGAPIVPTKRERTRDDA